CWCMVAPLSGAVLFEGTAKPCAGRSAPIGPVPGPPSALDQREKVVLTGQEVPSSGRHEGRKRGGQICYHRRERTACMELRRFFDQTIRASFHDLAMGGDPVAGYLADLLTRFARTDQLYPPGRAVPRLETVVDMLLGAQAAWREASLYFAPEQWLAIRRHIGDYTLFMMGVFRERVE